MGGERMASEIIEMFVSFCRRIGGEARVYGSRASCILPGSWIRVKVSSEGEEGMLSVVADKGSLHMRVNEKVSLYASGDVSTRFVVGRSRGSAQVEAYADTIEIVDYGDELSVVVMGASREGGL